MPPHEVRRCTPSEIAAILGLDLDRAIKPVPFDPNAEAWPPPFDMPPVLPEDASPTPAQTIRKLY